MQPLVQCWKVNAHRVQSVVAMHPVGWRRATAMAALTVGIAGGAIGILSAFSPSGVHASDHDDGDIDVRSRSLSLTDLYVFREVDQNPTAREGDLILVMNTNPRSLARQQYFFSNNARYEFRISRAANKDAAPKTQPDITLRFTFSRPTGNPQAQQFQLVILERDRQTQTISRNRDGSPLTTTPLASAENPRLNQFSVNGQQVTVFAGLREDPFFFDVEQFFRVRAGALGFGPAVGFRPADQALDFAKGYNVNTIVVRVPRSLLQGRTQATTFDTWLSLLVPDPRTRQVFQTEQLARPGINEALLFTQRNLAAYNRIQPTTQNSSQLQAIAAEATQTLRAFGNSDADISAILGAFLPDVMRIDTTGPSGFAEDFNRFGSPVRGRKLKDDVVDVALGALTGNRIVTDNVSYEQTPGNPATGHQPLAPTFPYLAPPN
ncbi:DUF4331 family protein [Leptothermofonsia sichuanensis]|uniref:DUF4331 family protein n=1 Tax=Leptothermofonsia sichuanensis TaxID=2917832 RepID=UPI001CEC7968|nr:DUF4331 family protein [Leptothermofonsia sichuanensis]